MRHGMKFSTISKTFLHMWARSAAYRESGYSKAAHQWCGFLNAEKAQCHHSSLLAFFCGIWDTYGYQCLGNRTHCPFLCTVCKVANLYRLLRRNTCVTFHSQLYVPFPWKHFQKLVPRISCGSATWLYGHPLRDPAHRFLTIWMSFNVL